jgi:hypothetical protein
LEGGFAGGRGKDAEVVETRKFSDEAAAFKVLGGIGADAMEGAGQGEDGAVGVAVGELFGGETFGWRGRCGRGSGGAQRQEERGEKKAKKNGAHGGLALWRRTGLFLTNVIEKSERGDARC